MDATFSEKSDALAHIGPAHSRDRAPPASPRLASMKRTGLRQMRYSSRGTIVA
jgi:hypothetical protein